MPRPSKDVFLTIGFRASDSSGDLRTIELFGVPGQKLANGECIVNEKMRHFFDDLIVRKIFRWSRQLKSCDFQTLKIWLYDTETTNEERGYDIPKIDRRDLAIRSNIAGSQLERIYVLDNELEGSEYERWQRTAEDLFSPLFREFLAPPEPPSIFANVPIVQALGSMVDSIDPYGKMKQNLFFNVLIIQID